MKSLITYLDFYGTKPVFYITKRPRFNTITGLILSLTSVIILLLVGIYLFIEYMNGETFSIIYSKNSEDIDMDFDISKRIFFYHLSDENNVIIDRRILKTVPYIANYSESNFHKTKLKEVNCNQDDFSNNQKYQNVIKFNISEYKCIKQTNNEEVVIRRRKQPSENSYINLYVTKCTNDSEFHDCFSEEEINEKLKGLSIYLDFYLESSRVNHHNYKTPLTKYYYQNSLLLNTDSITNYVYFWRKVIYKTNNGIFFDNIKTEVEFNLDASIKTKDTYPLTTNIGIDNALGLFQFLLTVEYSDEYLRKYSKFFIVLSDFFAVYNLILKIGLIINYLLTNTYMKFYIINRSISQINYAKRQKLINNVNLFTQNNKEFNSDKNMYNFSGSPSKAKRTLNTHKNYVGNKNNESNQQNKNENKIVLQMAKDSDNNDKNFVFSNKYKLDISSSLFYGFFRFILKKNNKINYYKQVDFYLREKLGIENIFNQIKNKEEYVEYLCSCDPESNISNANNLSLMNKSISQLLCLNCHKVLNNNINNKEKEYGNPEGGDRDK